MTVNKSRKWLAGLLLVLLSSPVSAQFGDFTTAEASHDLQFFAPVDFDFENQAVKRKSGWFFSYDKLSWAAAGDRTEIGDPDVVVLSEEVYAGSAQTQGTPLEQYVVQNSIQDAPPEATFAWGERYEFGTVKDGHRWTIGIIDGPEVNSHATYGFNQLTIPNQLPLDLNNDPNFGGDTLGGVGFDLAITNGFNGGLPGTGSADITTTTNGFGSVHVNFVTPTDYLRGLRDYGPGATVNGPGYAVIGLVVDETGITEITLNSGADGLPDDLDHDLVAGFLPVFADPNGDGTLEFVGQAADFDDFYTFNIAFDQFFVRSTTETQGVELMYSIDLKKRHKMVKHQNNTLALGYGVRYLRLKDEFSWEGRGSILGRTFANTEAQNSIFGPQIQGIWTTQHGRWNLSLDGRCTLGFNNQDIDQIGAIGENAAPGALNRSATAQPNAVASGRTDNDFSPLVEFRAQTSYQITSSIAARLGYTAIFVDNITRSSQIQRWELPNLGTTEGGQQDIFINGANVGFDVVY